LKGGLEVIKRNELRNDKKIRANLVISATIITIGGLLLTIIGIGIALAIANGSYAHVEMTFNEHDPFNVVTVDPKKGNISTKIELLEGTDNVSYQIYYKRGYEGSYKNGATISYMDIGEISGPHHLVYQTGWWNWDIKTQQTNQLTSTTYRINLTIKVS